MTNEQINIAIAESLGEIDPRYTTTGGFIASYVINGVTVGFHGLPNYTSDLNACHEFENTVMLNSHTRLNYLSWLGWENDYASTVFACVNATARQRCEAYLRTLNLWK